MRSLKIPNAKSAAETLRDEIRRSAESRYDHRLHAVLLVAQGLSPPQVADWLGDSVRALELWVHRFQEKSLPGLREDRRPGRPSRLTKDQLLQALQAVRLNPSEAGLNAKRWNANALSLYLRSQGVNLKPRQCRNLLRQWRSQQPS